MFSYCIYADWDKYNMRTFTQFLNEKEKLVKLYGLGTGHSPGKAFGAVGPAKPGKPVYTGLNVSTIFPVPRGGKPKSGVIGS
jgi:hypothetical protein